MIFTNKDLKNMIIPLFFEQLLVMLVGIVDTFIVSFVGESAVSGVSLVNSFNTVFIYLFIALASGGTYIEVPNDYRASQYDHTADDYIKKKLSDRMYHLSDGTLVQRDWYSSFLLYCYDYRTKNIDRDRCISEFEKCYSKEKALIKRIEINRIKVLNSGIEIV